MQEENPTWSIFTITMMGGGIALIKDHERGIALSTFSIAAMIPGIATYRHTLE